MIPAPTTITRAMVPMASILPARLGSTANARWRKVAARRVVGWPAGRRDLVQPAPGRPLVTHPYRPRPHRVSVLARSHVANMLIRHVDDNPVDL